MQESITVSIPREIKQALDRERKAKGLSRSEVVATALKKYLVLRDSGLTISEKSKEKATVTFLRKHPLHTSGFTPMKRDDLYDRP